MNYEVAGSALDVNNYSLKIVKESVKQAGFPFFI